MTPLKDYTAFPSKAHVEGARTTRYEIRRSLPGNTGSVRWPGDQPTRSGYESSYRTKEQAQRACDRINGPNGACIVLNLRKEVLAELIASEEGSYEDARRGSSGRDLDSHVHMVAQRAPGRLIIRTREEAEDAYYAVCAGTFQSRNRACWNAAVRVANALREYANPETVKYWAAPYDKPEGMK